MEIVGEYHTTIGGKETPRLTLFPRWDFFGPEMWNPWNWNLLEMTSASLEMIVL